MEEKIEEKVVKDVAITHLKVAKKQSSKLKFSSMSSVASDSDEFSPKNRRKAEKARQFWKFLKENIAKLKEDLIVEKIPGADEDVQQIKNSLILKPFQPLQDLKSITNLFHEIEKDSKYEDLMKKVLESYKFSLKNNSMNNSLCSRLRPAK